MSEENESESGSEELGLDYKLRVKSLSVVGLEVKMKDLELRLGVRVGIY